MSEGSIKSHSTSNNIFNPLLNYVATKIRVEFKGSCLKQDNTIFTQEKLVNISIVYEINKNFYVRSYPALESCFLVQLI